MLNISLFTLSLVSEFCCSYDHIKLSFYRVFNYSYSKSKAANSELTSVFLLKAHCLPIVRYALDATRPTASSLKTLDNLVSNAVRKIFGVTTAESVLTVRQTVDLCSVSVMRHRAACKLLL